MKRGFLFLAVFVVFSIVMALSPLTSGYNNGIGDSNAEYGCSTGCHTVQSSSVVTIWTPDNTIAEGDTAMVVVNVTGGEASGTPLGVHLLSALATSNSLPSATGWTILSDPTGTTNFSYHETPSYSGSVSWTWTLKAPDTAGAYSLYAREVHGNGDTFSRDFTTGLVFLVGSQGPPGTISVVITSPIQDSEVSGTLTVAVSLIPSENITYATLRIDGALLDNKTSPPFSWTIDTRTYTDGTHVVRIETANETGGTGSDEITIVVNNSEIGEETISWIWTLAAGSVAMIALVAVLVVGALALRQHKMNKGVK